MRFAERKAAMDTAGLGSHTSDSDDSVTRNQAQRSDEDDDQWQDRLEREAGLKY
jgi:hypothetical protein